jgi:hypothetical protein
MKMINYWPLHNKLKASMLIEPANYLVTRSYLMSRNHVGSFYSRLYSVLDKDGYFNEDN